MALVPLGKGKFAEIDEEDVVAVMCGHKWHLNKSGYAQSTVEGRPIRLHKFVAKLMRLEGRVDHRDRNPLNCKRKNLRAATSTQNSANSTKRYASSGYPGVYKNYDGYVAQITINRKVTHLARSKDPVFLFGIYKKKHIEIFGEFSPYFEENK